MTLKGYFTLVAASLILLSCHKNKGGEEQLVKPRIVDKIAGARVWQGFYSMDVYVGSVVHHDTLVVAPFTDSISVVDDSTIKFSGTSHMFATENLSYQYTDSVKGYAYYLVKHAYDSWLYYYYKKDSLHCAHVTSGIHNGWLHLFTP